VKKKALDFLCLYNGAPLKDGDGPELGYTLLGVGWFPTSSFSSLLLKCAKDACRFRTDTLSTGQFCCIIHTHLALPI